MTVVGVLGIGLMGSAIAARLSADGVHVIAAGDGRSEESRERIRGSGAVDVGSTADLVDEADIVLSIMGSRAAVEVGDEVVAALDRRSSPGTVFVDCNLIAPRELHRIAEALAVRGVATIDVGIVGPPPQQGTRSPTFYAAGVDLEPLGVLSAAGLTVVPVGVELGRASALKLASAGVWQGCLALMTEVLVAARSQGVLEVLLDDLARNQPMLAEWFSGALPDAVSRARRWSDDMVVVGESMRDGGASPAYHLAAAALYRRLAAADPQPDVASVVAALND